MGSLNASGIPVAAKNNYTFRKRDIRILQTDSSNDTETVITSNRPSLNRTITSGTIVRDDNVSAASVEYYEDLAWGLHIGGRSSSARLARTGARDLDVEDEEISVIPGSLSGNNPQEWAYNLGERVVRRESVNDSTIDRVLSSGVFD